MDDMLVLAADQDCRTESCEHGSTATKTNHLSTSPVALKMCIRSCDAVLLLLLLAENRIQQILFWTKLTASEVCLKYSPVS